jgi:hypothetical protein
VYLIRRNENGMTFEPEVIGIDLGEQQSNWGGSERMGLAWSP